MKQNSLLNSKNVEVFDIEFNEDRILQIRSF